jgi:wobble nucleotide-excising tRNase
LSDNIRTYNENLAAMVECDEAFSSSKDPKFHEWVEEGVRLHAGASSCLFCHSSNMEQSIEEWKEKLKEKGTASRKALQSTISSFQSQIQSFSNSFGDKVMKLLPKLGESVGDFQKFLLEIQESLAKRIQIDPGKFPTLSVDPSVQDSAKQYDSLCRHVLLKKKTQYFAPFYFEKSINDKIESTQKSLDDSLEKTAKDSKNQINNFLTQMKSGIQISVSQNNAAGNRKLSLERDAKGSNFGTYSDGELHQIALAVFLSNLIRKKPENSIIVFDDPVVSLDISKYHSFKKCLFNLRLTQLGSNQIVIFTHNFHFMLVLLSMFIDGGDLKKLDIMDLWATGKSGFKKIEDPESIAYDDFTLFGKAASQCSTYPQFVRLEWLLQRFPRVALDLKLRFYCQTSGQEPAKDLESIFAMDPEAVAKRDELLLINDTFSKRLHEKKLPDPQFFQTEVDSVRNFFRLLGLPEPFANVCLTNVEKISMPANQSDISLDDEAPLVFRIIDAAKSLYDSGDDSFKAYFRHPRYQLTESILNTVGTADTFSH